VEHGYDWTEHKAKSLTPNHILRENLGICHR
jgi:hypothetical protein